MDVNFKALLTEKTSFSWGCAFMYAGVFLSLMTYILIFGCSVLVNIMYEHMAVNWDGFSVVFGPIQMLGNIAFILCGVLFFWYPWGCETIDFIFYKIAEAQTRFDKDWGTLGEI